MLVQAKADLEAEGHAEAVKVSSVTGLGLKELMALLVERARAVLPPIDRVAFNRRQREWALASAEAVGAFDPRGDLLVGAEQLRIARRALDRIVGRDSTEEMLDALFGRFCIGK